jgi:hypothetical protein
MVGPRAGLEAVAKARKEKTNSRPREGGAGIAQRYSAGLPAGCSRIRIPIGAENFSSHHRVQTGSGVHPAFYLMGTMDSFFG